MSFHSVVPAPRTILTGVRKLPPATLRVIEPDGVVSRPPLLGPAFARDPDRADWSERDWQDALIDKLRDRGRAADGRRRAGRGAAVRRHRLLASSSRCWPRPGQHGLKTFSIGFDSAGGESGDEFEYSTWSREHFDTDHHRIKIDSSRLLPGIDAAIAAMSEPMVSHDCVAFYLLSEDVREVVKVVQSGQGADEVLGGYDWYPPLVGVPATRPWRPTRGSSSTGAGRRWPACCSRTG